MTTIYTFTYNGNIASYPKSIPSYHVLGCTDNIQGEYVPLKEYEVLQIRAGNMSQEKERDIIQRDERIFELETENETLKAILRQWAEISPALDDFDIVEGQSPELQQLIAATRAVLGE